MVRRSGGSQRLSGAFEDVAAAAHQGDRRALPQQRLGNPATDARADGRIFNVGTGQAAEIGALARTLAARLGKEIAPSLPGEYRPGEMRALISDISRIAELGFAPQTGLEAGIGRYLDWIGTQGDIKEYFSAAERALRRRQIVKRTGS